MLELLYGNIDYDNLASFKLVIPNSILSQLIQELTCGHNGDIPKALQIFQVMVTAHDYIRLSIYSASQNHLILRIIRDASSDLGFPCN
jgi:hypothetical protein